MASYRFLGASVGNCAGVLGCQEAPAAVKKGLKLEPYWEKTIRCTHEKNRLDAIADLAEFSEELAEATLEIIQQQRHFITIGGDHSCAIGTWSGVHKAVGDYGLIWIDAHMDAHVPESSPTGNLHGMPIAALLGHGAPSLTGILDETPKLKPENLVLIGIRSYEPAEETLLRKLGVKLFTMDKVNELGYAHCWNEAIHYFQSKNLPYGVSFDLDGLDPSEIDALGTPVEKGIMLKDTLECFESMPVEKFIGIEITEYNPSLDFKKLGIPVISKILKALPINIKLLS